MSFSSKDMRAYAANPLNAIAMASLNMDSLNMAEISADMSARQLADASVELARLPACELRSRIGVFLPELRALVRRLSEMDTTND